MRSHSARLAPLAFSLGLAFFISVTLLGCDLNPNLSPEEHIQRAKDLQSQKEYKGSILELKNAIQKAPENAQARWLLGETYLILGQGPEAEKELVRAQQLGVAFTSVQPQLVRALLLQGQYEQALQKALPAEQAIPALKAQLLNLQGEARLGLRQVESGCQLFQDALAFDAKLSAANRGLARCAMHKRNVDEARARMRQAIENTPEDVENWLMLGNIELNQNNLSAAGQHFSKALSLEPGNRHALSKHAFVALSQKNLDLARKDLKLMQDIAPKSADLLYLDAAIKYHEGNYQAAMPMLQELLGLQPNHITTNYLAGLVAYELASYQQAIGYLSKVVNAVPNHPDARKYLASAQYLVGDAKSAYQTLIPIALETRDSQTLALLSKIQYGLGQPVKALSTLSDATRLAPQNQALKTQLAQMYFQAGDETRGFEELTENTKQPHETSSADVLLVTQLINNKRPAEALGVAERLIRKSPDSVLPYNLKGMAQVANGDVAAAYSSFEQAYSLDPSAIASLLNLTQLDIQAKRFDKARPRLQEYIKKHPAHAQAMTTLAELEAAAGHGQEQMNWLEKAVKANPAYLPAQSQRIRRLLSEKRFDQALAAAHDAQVASPSSPEALALLAETQFMSNDLVNAAAGYKKLAQQLPAPGLLYRLAIIQTRLGNPKEAITTLNKLLSQAPGSTQAMALLAELHIAEKRFAEAAQVIERTKQAQPKSATGWYLEGGMLASQGKHGPALQAYKTAHQIAADARSVTRLHLAMVRAGMNAEAESLINDWLNKRPHDVQARRYLATFHYQQQRTRDSIAQYAKLLSHAPNDLMALNNLALQYSDIKDPRALAMAERAHKLAPNDPSILDTYGWVLVQSGKLKTGITYLQKAHTAKPGNPEIAFHLATALAKNGETKEARTVAKAAAKRTSSRQQALQELLKTLGK